MALQINTNLGALMASAAASSVNRSMETSMNRLSTGLRINAARDDAAGVAIASRLTSEITGINQAIRNASDGQAMIDTAEGAHNEIVNILQRMRELAVQGANDTNNAADRANLQSEVTQLKTEIDRIAEVSSWAGKKLLYGNADSGTGTKTFTLQVGTGTSTADRVDVKINSMTSTALALKDANATVDIKNISETGYTTGDPIITDFAANTANKGTLTLAAGAADNEITLTPATATAADKWDFKIEGVAIAFETQKDAAFATNEKGLGAELAALINSKGIAGITAAADAATGVVTVTKAASTSVTAGANKLTINSYDQDETIKIDLDGTTVSFKNDAAEGYTLDKAGAAAALADAINAANISGISASASGAVVTLTKGNFDITTAAGARAAVDAIDTAIGTVNTQRANLGAISNRLDSTVSNLTNIATNLEAGRSRIQDADFAAESTNLAKSQILQQASTAMLAQANASKQGVLSLLQG